MQQESRLGNNDREDAKSRSIRNSSRRTGSGLRVVRVDFSPGPDAEDRLRRLFTLLVKHATKDRPNLSRADDPSTQGGDPQG